MNLDERSLEWLKGKSDTDYPAPCVRIGKRGLFSMHYCLKACDGNRAASPEYCPLASDFRDAAEFEARVNVILANGVESCEHCPAIGWCDFPACEESRIKYARLVVEEEMELEGK